MVKHIVMWKLKDEARSRETIEKMRGLLTRLVGLVPGLLSLEFYETMAPGESAADACIVTEFPSVRELEAYDAHPEHQKAREFIRSVVATRMVMDSE